MNTKVDKNVFLKQLKSRLYRQLQPIMKTVLEQLNQEYQLKLG